MKRALALALALASLAVASTARATDARTAPAPTPTAPTAPTSPARNQVLVLDLDAIDVDKTKISILNGRIASLLSERSDVEAVTVGDIQAMAKIGANKAAAGCDDASCLAEIANALGARYVVYGRVGKLDDVIVLQLNLFDATVGKPVSRQEAQGARLQDLSQKMPDVVRALLRPLRSSSGGASSGSSSGGSSSGSGGSSSGGSSSGEGGAGGSDGFDGSSGATGSVGGSGGSGGAGGGASAFTSPLFLVGAGSAALGAVVGVGFGAWALALNGDLDSQSTTLDKKQFAFDNGIWVASTAIGGGVLAAAGVAVVGVSLME